jgi:hypothetical protein
MTASFLVEVGAGRVDAWAARPVPFEATGVDRELRSALRAALDGLDVGPDGVLSATYWGDRHRRSDIENVVLYNVDDTGRRFGSGRGIRFEHATGRRPDPDGRSWPCSYGYRLAPVGGYGSWSAVEVLAEWSAVTVAVGPGRPSVAGTWLALRQARLSESRTVGAGPVALELQVGAPAGVRLPPLVKPLIDGVVSALATDDGSPQEAVGRLARALGLDVGIARDLLTVPNAPFGRHRLLALRGAGLQWQPPDDLLVAGEVLRSTGRGTDVTVAGRLVAVRPRRSGTPA